MNLQNVFLRQAKTQQISVTIHLSNGFQLRGLIHDFDDAHIIVDCDGKQNLVYQHAVCTIAPSKFLSLSPETTTSK